MAKKSRKRRRSTSEKVMIVLGIVIAISMLLSLFVGLGRSRSRSNAPLPESDRFEPSLEDNGDSIGLSEATPQPIALLPVGALAPPLG